LRFFSPLYCFLTGEIREKDLKLQSVVSFVGFLGPVEAIDFVRY